MKTLLLLLLMTSVIAVTIEDFSVQFREERLKLDKSVAIYRVYATKDVYDVTVSFEPQNEGEQAVLSSVFLELFLKD